MEGCIVEEWLRSLGLVHYTQAFLDNGYDDLEVCKQVGDPDLDAIGVEDDSDRHEILAAVKHLLEEGGTRVYFTLEPEYQSPSPSATGADGTSGGPLAPHSVTNGIPLNYSDGLDFGDYDEALDYDKTLGVNRSDSGSKGSGEGPAVPGAGSRLDAYEVGRAALVTFPRIQLAAIIRDRTQEDGINLADLHSETLQPAQVGEGVRLEELAQKYSKGLKTHQSHVLETLRLLAEAAATSSDDTESTTEGDNVSMYSLFSVAGQSHRSVPPPLPSCPPPSTSLGEPGLLESVKGSPIYHRSPLQPQPNCHANEEPADYGDGTLKKKTGLGRFFKNMGARRSGRKYVYKQHEGDLHASEITMPEDDRIELMLLVKEGKISMHDAVETVKQYENWKRKQLGLDPAPPGRQDTPMLPRRLTPALRLDTVDRPDPKVKRVSFLLPLKLPTLKKKGTLIKQKSLSSAESPQKCRRHLHSISDYCEPPVEISPDEENFSGFPGFKVDLRSKPKRTDISDPSHVSTYSPSQWISPMLLRRYIKTDLSTQSEQSQPSREQRRGLFSSPFIRRKGSLDSKAPVRAPSVSLRTSGSFGTSETDRTSGKGHRVHLKGGPVAFGSRDSLREHLKGKMGLASSGGSVMETVTVATVHATDSSEDDQSKDALSDQIKSYDHSKDPLQHSIVPSGGAPTQNGDWRTCIVHRSPHRQSSEQVKNDENSRQNCHTQHIQKGTLSIKEYSRQKAECDTSVTTVKIETCVVCTKNDDTLKSELSKDWDSPDIGIEDTSPTGTLDSTTSEDFKDSKYGSSSTMSVGSDVSPVTERRNGNRAVIKVMKANMPRGNTNSAGEECLSSDYEDHEDPTMKTMNLRSSTIIKEVCTCKSPAPSSGSPRNLPSSPSTVSETSNSTLDYIGLSPRRQKSGRKSTKRPRPKTVEELLARLGLQHLHQLFTLSGYLSLEHFSEIEEEDLDDLSVTKTEDRAKILTAAQLLLDYEGGQEQSTFQADSASIGSSQSQSGISSCDSQHDVLLVTTTIPEDLETGPHSHSSSDEMNLQHATVSDQESSSECVDDGTLKAATGLPTDGTEDNEDGEMITISHDSSIAVPPTKQLLTFSATGTAQISKTSTSETPVTQNSGRVLPSQDVLKVIQRTSTGTCTSPNLGRRCLSDGSDSSIVCLKQNLTEGHVPDDADISPAAPLRRRTESVEDVPQESAARNKAQRASTGSGALNKPPKPKVPVRTVSLPTTTGGAACSLSTFKPPVETPAAPKVTSDNTKQTPIPAARLGKISSVRDKV